MLPYFGCSKCKDYCAKTSITVIMEYQSVLNKSPSLACNVLAAHILHLLVRRNQSLSNFHAHCKTHFHVELLKSGKCCQHSTTAAKPYLLQNMYTKCTLSYYPFVNDKSTSLTLLTNDKQLHQSIL